MKWLYSWRQVSIRPQPRPQRLSPHANGLMMKPLLTLLSSGLVFLGAGCSVNSEPRVEAKATPAADYVITNGKVYTVDEQQPWAEAVAVKGDTIVYVGDNAGAAVFVGKGTEQVDLEGRLMLPGFVESHVHIALGAAFNSGVIIDFADKVEDVQRRVKEYADGHPDQKSIFGATYNGNLFDAKGPNKALLDAVVPDRPVYLLDHGGHGAWVNSKALEVAGITKDTKNPAGGEYVRDDKGEATGAIKGAPAHMPVLSAIEGITPESITSALTKVFEGMSEFGFTSAIDMGAVLEPEASHTAFIELDKAGKKPLRLCATHYVNTPELARTAVEMVERNDKRYKSDTLWFGALKVSVDSVIEILTAAMLEPYLTTGNRGMLYFDDEAMTKMALAAAEKGYLVTTHTYGDHANRVSLNAAEAVRKAGYKDALYSTTHSVFCAPADRPRWKQLDVTAQTTGVWMFYSEDYAKHLGEERAHTYQFPLREWLDSGVNVALGSDWPATIGGFEYGLNPFVNMFMAMHRRPPLHLADKAFGGISTQPLPPADQVMTLEEAIRGYTLAGAKMMGIDDVTGSIEVGKKADLILLSQNLFEIDPEKIADTVVLATMFDGRVVHDVVYELGDSDLVEVDEVDTDAFKGDMCVDFL